MATSIARNRKIHKFLSLDDWAITIIDNNGGKAFDVISDDGNNERNITSKE